MRDDAALRQCAGTKARLTEDLVFAWRALRPTNRTRSGRTARVHRLDGDACGRRRSTVAALTDAVRIWQQRGHHVVFLSFSKAPPSRTTQRCSQPSVRSSEPARRRSNSVAPPPPHPRSTAAFADIDVVCGMRFHGLVLAAMLERAFVGIVHDNKISAICRRFDMPCQEIAALKGADLVRSVEQLTAGYRTRSGSRRAARGRGRISSPSRRCRDRHPPAPESSANIGD